MNEDSGDFSDGLDEFEESADEGQAKKKGGTSYANKPYDEAYEVSQDLSMAESFDGRDKSDRERKLKNDKYDEAMDVSQSMDQGGTPAGKHAARPKGGASGSGVGDTKDESKGTRKGMQSDQTKSQTMFNKPFDEALEFSQSGSDESVDTVSERKSKGEKNNKDSKGTHSSSASSSASASASSSSSKPAAPPGYPQGGNQGTNSSTMQSIPTKTNKQEQQPQQQQQQQQQRPKTEDDSEEGDDDQEESYDNIEGAYNAKDYQHLNVAAEVRDLFQYIERCKPQEVELETQLKCFIPDYIPAIGEMDAYLKVPRPDGKEDDLGLKVLDEPAAVQSDPTVLELQLRAMSKKLQYGDVVVRSIENASKSPAAIEKWIQSINDLHRSKPPPQVHYRRNMPDIESLMDVWPEEFEAILETTPLPSPDLELSLAEYAKVLCAILDIPTYENPIESLHVLFTLYMDFRNNPHFQQRLGENAMFDQEGGVSNERGGKDGGRQQLGGADVLEIQQGSYK